MKMNSDFKDLLRLFAVEGVEYLIIGAYAVNHYTQPRYTKDLDLWIKPSFENAERIERVFAVFGIPLIEVTKEDFSDEGLQYAVGVPPCMIDFLTSVPGTPPFDKAWEDRTTEIVDGFEVHYLGKNDLIAAKKTAGRLQDLADIDEIHRADG